MIGLLPFAPSTPNEAELARLVRSLAAKNVAASYSVDPTDNTIRVDTTGGNVTISLPAAALMQERVVTVKKISADANTVTVTPATGDTIDGASSLVLTTQWQSFALQSDGTTWSKVWAHDTATPASVAAEAATRAAADSAEASARAAADTSEATSRANADSLLQAKSEKNAASGYAGLDASSKLTGSQQKYGTAANTACEGNDSRLSDSRAPSGSAGGDLTGSFPSPTIAADAVTYAKMQNVSATDKLLGRSSAGAGDVQEIACTAAARSILDDATIADILTTLGTVAVSVNTFTPTWTPASGSGATVNIATGFYIKVGHWVIGTIRLGTNGHGTSSGNITIGGFPFSSTADVDAKGGGICLTASNMSITAGQNVTMSMNYAASTASPLIWNATTGTGIVTAAQWGVSGVLDFLFAYRTDS